MSDKTYRRVVVREGDPALGIDEIVAVFYQDKVVLSAGTLGMVVLSPEEAARFGTEAVREHPLDALSQIRVEED